MPFKDELVALGIEVPVEEEIVAPEAVATEDVIMEHVEGMGDMLGTMTQTDFISLLKGIISKYESLE